MKSIIFFISFNRAKSADEFPQRMQECLRPGPNGCFYEDFYRYLVTLFIKILNF